MIRLPRSAIRRVTLVILAALCSAARDPRATGPTAALDVRLGARAFEPGEPVRVEVSSPVSLSSLGGSFLGRPVFFVRSGPGAASRERWSGWAAVDLDRRAGPATLEVTGRDAHGSKVAGTRAVTIAAHAFPEERMTVDSRYVSPPPGAERRIESDRRHLAAVYATRTRVVPPAAPFVAPVPGEPTSIFGARRTFNGQPRDPHPGLDLRAAEGTPVNCSGAGQVILAGDLYYSGNTVIVDHGGGLFTVYAHLSSIDVREGRSVEAGTRLGLSGATGRVTGPHLHWGAKIGDVAFDPRALLDPRLFR